MSFLRNPYFAILLGGLLMVALAIVGGRTTGSQIASDLSRRSVPAIAAVGAGSKVVARFQSPNGFPTRHPTLSGAEGLDEAVRDRIAKAVAAVPGVGGIRWEDGSALAKGSQAPVQPLNCQTNVEALLRARTIRFEEGSARIDISSFSLVDEVAAALRPCLGSIIAITGHTDTSGTEPGNLELSQERADAVKEALIERGIPADGLRARGVGSRIPVEGLSPADPANRRIEFSVIAIVPVTPTPVDTPGPR